jgi:anti-sigma B factor antagonist
MAAEPHTMPVAPPPTVPGRTRGQLASEIADGLVKLWRERSGTGPRRARAHVTDSHVTCLFEGTLTPAERTLAARGRADLVRAQRDELRASLQGDAILLVEQVTGRRVLAALGDCVVEPDHAVQTFVLGGPRPLAAAAVGLRDPADDAIPEPLQVELRQDGDELHVRPVGELDLASVDALRGPLDHAVTTGHPVVLELDGLTFLDSAGVGLIVQAWEAARRAGVALRCTPGRPAIQRTLQVAGLEGLLDEGPQPS